MKRRTHAAFDTLLGWAGFGLGYVEEDTRPVVGAHARSAETTHRTASVAPRQSVVDAATEVEGVAADTGHWTDMLTLSTERRLEAVHSLEERIADRWEGWKARQRASWSSRWSRAARTPPSLRAEPHGTTKSVRVPIQRDRNSKVLQRIALDRQLQGGGEGHPLATDHTEDLRERQVFADVWEIEDPPQHQPSTERSQTDQVPVVERLQRLLSPDDMASATTRDEGVR